MTSVQSYYKEPTSIRRQFTVYPYYASGVNTFFTVQNNTLSRAQYDLSGVDYVVARDLGKEVEIKSIDPNLLALWTADAVDTFADFTNAQILKKGTARKFQVLSMTSGDAQGADTYPGEQISRLWYNDNYFNTNLGDNYAAGGEAYMDAINSNGLFNTSGQNMPINDLLIVGQSQTTFSNNVLQNLPFGTFYAVNDPIIVGYSFSGNPISRAIKNRIDETTLF
jgi:hypothetical protein